MLCKSDYPITAAMASNSMHHEDVVFLKDIILEYVESSYWPMYDKIISLLYISNEEKLLRLFDSIEDTYVFSNNIKSTINFLVEQSEYKLVFNLLYMAVRSKHSSTLFYCLNNIEINEFYVKQNINFLQESVQILYKKKEYDSLFYLCKIFNILQYLQIMLQRDYDELVREFLDTHTINGIRLAFRLMEQDFNDVGKAYELIISEISKMNKSEEIQYIYFCYLLKFIRLKKQINPELKERLLEIGEVELLKKRSYGVHQLVECLETILFSNGIEGYYELVQILNVNHIFNYEKEIPKILPYYIYKDESLDKIKGRKEYFRILKDEDKWEDKKLFYFYMNSFFKYVLSIHDFFEAIYEDKEDGANLKGLCKGFEFYGKIESIDVENGTAIANFQNVVAKHWISLSSKNVGKNHIGLLQIGDEFSFALRRFFPSNGFITITSFKLLNSDRQKQLDELDLNHWEVFQSFLKEIISKQEFSTQDKEKLEEIPHVKFKKIYVTDEYNDLYSEVLFNLRYKVEEIIAFLTALEKHNNNLYSVDQNASLNRADFLLIDRSKETVDSLINQNINEKDLIWIYANSYLRLMIEVQVILDSIICPGEDELKLDSLFYEYRFYGYINNLFVNYYGVKSVFVNAASIKTSRNMSFLLGKECGVTEKMVEDKIYVSFRLRKYFKKGNKIAIEDVRSHGRERVKLQNWSVIHGANDLIKYNGRVFKETLEEMSKLPKLNFIKIEHKRFLSDFVWCMNNLCKNRNDLFLYIKALHNNNPYYYTLNQSSKTSMEYTNSLDIDQSRIILQQLIDNKYNLYKILQIYINSFMRYHIPIYIVLEEYYKSNDNMENRNVFYMSGTIQKISLTGTITQIKDNCLFLNLNHITCKCNVCVKLDDTDYSILDFNENQRISIRLSEHHRKERTIYTEIFD